MIKILKDDWNVEKKENDETMHNKQQMLVDGFSLNKNNEYEANTLNELLDNDNRLSHANPLKEKKKTDQENQEDKLKFNPDLINTDPADPQA